MRSRIAAITARLPGVTPQDHIAHHIALAIAELLTTGRRDLVNEAITVGYELAVAEGADFSRLPKRLADRQEDRP